MKSTNRAVIVVFTVVLITLALAACATPAAYSHHGDPTDSIAAPYLAKILPRDMQAHSSEIVDTVPAARRLASQLHSRLMAPLM